MKMFIFFCGLTEEVWKNDHLALKVHPRGQSLGGRTTINTLVELVMTFFPFIRRLPLDFWTRSPLKLMAFAILIGNLVLLVQIQVYT